MSSVKGHTLQTNVEQKKLVQKRLERISVLSSENSRLFFAMFLCTFVRPVKWPMLYSLMFCQHQRWGFANE